MSEWISVEDRLPDDAFDGVAVIVVVTNCHGKVVAETDAWDKAKCRFDFWRRRVTHWMPLPPPPTT